MYIIHDLVVRTAVNNLGVIPEGCPESGTLLNGPVVEVCVVTKTSAMTSVDVLHEVVHIAALDAFFRRLPKKFTHGVITSLLVLFPNPLDDYIPLCFSTYH